MHTLLSLAGTFRKGQKGKAGKTSRGYARGRVFGVLQESLFTLQPEMLLYIYIYNCRDSKCQTMAGL